MSTDFLIAVEGNRTAALKKKIIHYYIANGDATIADLCKEPDKTPSEANEEIGLGFLGRCLLFCHGFSHPSAIFRAVWLGKSPVELT